jgi:hypothetical protein
VSGWETGSTYVTNSVDKTVTLACPTGGKKVLGGGYSISISNAVARENYPSADNQWTVTAVKTSGSPGSWTLTVYIICGSA